MQTPTQTPRVDAVLKECEQVTDRITFSDLGKMYTIARTLELELAEARRRGDRMDRLLSLVEQWSQPDVDGANWYDARREALAEWRAAP